MKFAKIYKFINETLDLENIEGYPYDIAGLETKFKTELGECQVSFDIIPLSEIDYPPVIVIKKALTDCYNIQYTIENNDTQFVKSNYHYLIRILKTITDIIEETIIRNDSSTEEDIQNIYCIGSISKLGNLSIDSQKDMIYRQIAKNRLPIGYRINEIKFKGINISGFAITKNKL